MNKVHLDGEFYTTCSNCNSPHTLLTIKPEKSITSLHYMCLECKTEKTHLISNIHNISNKSETILNEKMYDSIKAKTSMVKYWEITT